MRTQTFGRSGAHIGTLPHWCWRFAQRCPVVPHALYHVAGDVILILRAMPSRMQRTITISTS